MPISIHRLQQRLKEPPASVPPQEYRFFIFTNYAFLIAGGFHFCFIFLMVFLKLYPLAVYNLFSSLVWAVAIILNLKGVRLAPYILADVEVLVHAGLTAIFIGWDAGFHYYILAASVVVFLSYFSMKLKITLAVGNSLGYILINFLSQQIAPFVTVDRVIIQTLNYANLLGISFTISFMAYYYRHNVLKMEAKLAAEHRRTVQALDDRNQALKQINADLADAADYVRTVLPPPLHQGPVRSDWRYIPSTSLGGDAFGYHWLDRHHFGVYLLDVSGHGVGAALLSVTVMNVLRTHALPGTDFRMPDQVLTALSRAFPTEENNDMFFTIWYGVYNHRTRDLAYASGGHPPALLVSGNADADSRIELLQTGNQIVGGIKGATYQKASRRLKDSACLYVFSDGVYEFQQQDGRMWYFRQFADFLHHQHRGGHNDLEGLITSVRERLKGDDFDDDVTLLKLSFT
jgi:sigma-B regulation protein RsbU (phosphoserine phosphatase)